MPAPTWKAQDGEVGPALGEARALPHTAPPEPFVLEHGGDGVVIQVLGAPHVHPRGSDAAGQAEQGQEEAHHLERGGGHGLSPGPAASLQPKLGAQRALPRGTLLIRGFL